MKTFSDITAIKPKLLFSIDIEIQGNLIFDFTVNNYKCREGKNVILLDLLDPIKIQSNIISKSTTNSAISIINASVNDYVFLPLYKHLSSNKDAWHNHVGKWTYQIDKPFYVWFHEVSGQGWIA